MNLKKFISGVSAFAVAATAFAAMAVPAGAKDYSANISLVAENFYNMASYKSGKATAKSPLSNGAYAAARKDFSGLTGIADASTVTVEFDTAVSSGNIVVFGVGDASLSTSMVNGSDYKPQGRAIYFGSLDGSNYKAYDSKSGASRNIGTGAFAKIVHASVTFDRETGTYSYEISLPSTGAKISDSGFAADINNLTYVDAFTKTSGAQFQFNNIKVSYTVTKPTVETNEVELGDLGTNDGVYAKAFTSDITYNGIAIDNVKVEVEGKEPQVKELGHIESDVRIGIILASKDSSKLEGITPTITVNVD